MFLVRSNLGAMRKLQRMLGRTYRLADIIVRVESYDERCVTFAAVERNVRFVNASVTHAEFFRLNLEEV